MGGIFKAYDIRGIYGETINEDIVYRIGRAYVLKFKTKKITIGRDCRISSPKLFEALVRGVTDQGCDVLDIGLVSTPMMYFSVWKFKHDGGIVITASHNPPKYNGLKMVREDSIPIGGETGIYEIEEMIKDLPSELPEKKGIVADFNVFDPYLEHITNYMDLTKLKKFNIAIDTANGMAGPIAAVFFDKLDCDLIHMYPVLDGNFPNHEANPLKEENVEDLKKIVIEKKCDIGIAFDGDSDRCSFVDEKGQIVPSDYVIALVAKEMLKEHKGKTILYDVRCSRIVGKVIKDNGGKTGRCPVGHSLVKKQMREQDIYFAGELSSHFYYQEEHYAEAPFFVILKILQIMTEENKPLSELVEPLKVYSHTGEINSKVEDKSGKMKELAEKFSDGNVSYLDGVTVEYTDWWFNVRPSNTEPYLRLNLEADTKELMDEKRDLVLGIIRNN
ncbi:phosphomannomutase/phosphoglucomutase [archaeon]|jgi:phosphomannomutase|nr:phosphomannomutase/phosphoglucomutase [archaeon]MBT4273184.1 phosphomannomutase/phosphoglucomutase [archaeon]MBT4460289.1 phosphomannomutase/phosphoglucomutase [archaeon]MBT4858406.1 phosphomannomutase/phosphoglucomutase [archaeon]MBT5423758.1 phosphomannomutase/phosphoglucomutase [archaeon]